MFRVTIVGWIVLLVTGCNQIIVSDKTDAIMTATLSEVFSPSTAVNPIATITPENEQETPVMNESSIHTPLGPSLEQFVNPAKEDLADRLSIDIKQIELIEFKAMVWPDSSMGCPQPGMEYTQVQREGYFIRLQYGDKLFDYHGGGNRPPFLCEKATGDAAPLLPPSSGDD